MIIKNILFDKTKYNGDNYVISARLPNDMIKKIDNIAEKNYLNRNEVVTRFLDYALKNIDYNNK